jgi:putative FmdB family regulatory protein
MPTYEYQCDECTHKFEAFHGMSADPIKDCPQCGVKGRVRRLISGGAGFIFKGSGFYITDYRSESYKKAAAADKPASANGSNGSSGGSTSGGSTSGSSSASSGSSSSGSSGTSSSGGGGTAAKSA